MKKIFPDCPDVPQGVANRGARVIERYFRLHRVARAGDLPEEARVRLLRDLESLLSGGSGPGNRPDVREGGQRGLWKRMRDWLDSFFGFGDTSVTQYFPLAICTNAIYCDGLRQSTIVSTARRSEDKA
jgi:hypothetical protein